MHRADVGTSWFSRKPESTGRGMSHALLLFMSDPNAPPPSSRTVLCLTAHVTAASIAEASRDAWLVFIEQSDGWSKAELMLWCGALYAPVARFAEVDGYEADDDYRFVDRQFVERMIETARARALEVLSSFALPRARLAFSRAMHDEGAVTRCKDQFGGIAFAPTPATDSLVDRVLSLIAADLFARPEDFEGEAVCSGCGGIVMGRTFCCARHARRTGRYVAKPADTLAVPMAG